MAYNFKEVNVLIVESSPQLYELMRSVMMMLGVPQGNIDPAYTVEEAYRRFCNRSHDLVILDWLDADRGIQLTKQIRMETSPNPFVPVLMTAGSGHKQKVIKARDAGVSDYLVKPFTARQLGLKIETIVERPRPFVVSQNYIGPNRRIRELPFLGVDKRTDEPVHRNYASA